MNKGLGSKVLAGSLVAFTLFLVLGVSYMFIDSSNKQANSMTKEQYAVLQNSAENTAKLRDAVDAFYADTSTIDQITLNIISSESYLVRFVFSFPLIILLSIST